jgi:TFIIF-interacting CTD phosphatase-like protein
MQNWLNNITLRQQQWNVNVSINQILINTLENTVEIQKLYNNDDVYVYYIFLGMKK